MNERTISFIPLFEALGISPDADGLAAVVSQIIPASVAEQFWAGDSHEIAVPSGTLHTGYLGISGGTELAVPGVPFVALIVGDPGPGIISFRYSLLAGDTGWMFFLDDLSLSLKFDAAILRSVARQNTPDERAEVRFTAGISIDSEFNVQLTPFTASLEESFIAGTELIVSAEGVGLDLNAESPSIFFSEFTLQPPPDLFSSPVPLPRMSVTDAVISRSGFSGRVLADWKLEWEGTKFVYRIRAADGSDAAVDAQLFDIKGGIHMFAMDFENNVPVRSEIQGSLLVPYFNTPVNIRAEIDDSGSFALALSGAGPGGILLKKDELLALNILSLTAAKEGNLGTVKVSGGLEPLLMASDGLEWPRLDVTDLSIDTEGRVKIREAWLDLKDLASLDLWGFHFELNRVGIGYDEPVDKLWVDLTGSLRLIEQLPIGLGVEGFRVTWPRLLYEELGFDDPGSFDLEQAFAIAERIEVKFDGVHLFYGIPNAVEFEGFIRFIKEAQKIGFAGDVILRVPASGFSAEAGLMVGMNFEDPPYPFLYVYFGLELPKGIPLGQSGLALKGALGLFGLNVSPDKTPEQNWYYDWYKRGPMVGAHPTNKWRDERMAIALGGGITITTTDGYIKGVKGLFVLAIPGPIIVLEGRSLILDGLGPSEPPLRALAIFDGREKVVQFNIEAEAELVADLLHAYGMLEAFFDFNDLTNWHLYMGQDEPDDRRIRASVLKLRGQYLFDANAYLMIDMVGSTTVRARMGVHVGFEPQIPPLGPVKLELEAVLEGQGEVTILPEQFSGDVALSGNVKLAAFGFGFQLAANADMLTEGPEPFSIDATLTVLADLPFPLDDVEATVSFHWETPPQPEWVPPLSNVVMDSEYAPGGGELETYDFAVGDRRIEADASPVVPMDAMPTLLFGHDMYDSEDHRFGRDSNTPPDPYQVGLMEFTPSLLKVELYRALRGSGGAWELIASSSPAGDEERLEGVWLAEAAAENATVPAARRLRLWGASPFIHANVLNWTGIESSYTESFLVDHPDYFACGEHEASSTCVGFRDVKEIKLSRNVPWVYESLTWTTAQSGTFASVHGETCMEVEGGVRIRFPEGVVQVSVRFCREPRPGSASEVALRRQARSASELDEVRMTAETTGELPDFEGCHFAVEQRVAVSGLKWTIEGKEPFRCVELPGRSAIVEVCYVTLREMTRARFSHAHCEENRDYYPGFLSAKQRTLVPGAYYKLRVETDVEASLARMPPGLLGSLYSQALATLTGSDTGGRRAYTEEAFFQTAGPPHNLGRYVKWTNPLSGATRVFRGDSFSVRFLRSYVSDLYSAPEHALEGQIRGADGEVAQGYQSTWAEAASASLTPDEQRWQEHLDEHPDGPILQPRANDDVLEVRRSAPAPLKPNARYDLVIFGGEGGELLFEDDFRGNAPGEAWGQDRARWSVANGELGRTSGPRTLTVGDSGWRDIDMTVELKGATGETGIVFRFSTKPSANGGPATDQYYRLVVTRTEATLERAGSQVEKLDEVNQALAPDEWYRFRVSVIGDRIRVWRFAESLFDVVVPAAATIRLGKIGLYASGTTARFRRIRVREAALMRVGFMTSEFERFSALIESARTTSHSGSVTIFSPASLPVDPPDQTAEDAVAAAQAWASAQREWEEGLVDFRDKVFDRERLEELKLELRERKAWNDDRFRVACQSMGIPVFDAVRRGLEVINLKHSGTKALLGLWVRSSETLNLKRSIDGDHVGRTEIGLTARPGTTLDPKPLGFTLIHDTDSTQALLLLSAPVSPEASRELTLTFTYDRNHGDEFGSGDHRHDRPVERFEDESERDVSQLVWSI